MPDPTDGLESHYPTKFKLANVMIYLAPFGCFGWCGPLWKVASVVAIGFGVWRSQGFLRRAFGGAFLLSLLIWGVHARVNETDWPGPPLFMAWWLLSFGTRWHADGAKAEAEAANPRREWD
jgi:hypothetical protein